MSNLETRADFVRGRLRELNTHAGNIIIENAMLLSEIKSNGYHQEWGYSTFEEAIQAMQNAGEIDYGPRQARNFLAIGRMMTELGLSDGDISDVTISKLREIATVPDANKQRQLLDEAKELSVSDVQQRAKAARDKHNGHDVDPLKAIVFKMTDTQHVFFQTCLEHAKVIYGINDNTPDAAVLVDSILADWYSEAINASPDPEASADQTGDF